MAHRRLFTILIELPVRLVIGRYLVLVNLPPLSLERWGVPYHDGCVVVVTIPVLEGGAALRCQVDRVSAQRGMAWLDTKFLYVSTKTTRKYSPSLAEGAASLSAHPVYPNTRIVLGSLAKYREAQCLALQNLGKL